MSEKSDQPQNSSPITRKARLFWCKQQELSYQQMMNLRTSEPIMFRYVSYQSYDDLLQCSDMFRFISESVDVVTRCSSVHCMSHVLRGNTVVDRCRPRAWGILSQFVHHAWIYVGFPGYIFCKLYTVALYPEFAA